MTAQPNVGFASRDRSISGCLRKRLISLVSAAMFLPWLLLSLPAGAIVDRHDRVALMWRSQAVQFAVGQQPGAVQHPRVRPGGEQIVGRQPPVELDADRQPRQRFRGPGFEPPAP